MKKLVALFVGLLFIGVFATSVSAAEYEVKKGDTLWDIAMEHDTDVEKLMELNELKTSLIFPKQVLKINERKIDYYIVKKGDTLYHISKTHSDGATVTSLKAWNDLSSDLIVTGQRLIINGPEPAQLQATKQDTKETVETSTTATITKSEPDEEKASMNVSEKKEDVEGRTFTVEATAYTAYCPGCSGITATGLNLMENPNAKVIAVDPNVIPLGTKVYVEGYGYAIASDTGGAINGRKIDVHFATKEQAYNWGRRSVEVTIVN